MPDDLSKVLVSMSPMPIIEYGEVLFWAIAGGTAVMNSKNILRYLYLILVNTIMAAEQLCSIQAIGY